MAYLVAALALTLSPGLTSLSLAQQPRLPDWSGWSEVPGGGFTPSGPAATVDYSGQYHVYVRGTDDRIFENFQNRLDGFRWSGWSEFNAYVATVDGPPQYHPGFTLSEPAAGAFSGGVLVRGLDSRIYADFTEDCATYCDTDHGSWHVVGGNYATPSEPAFLEDPYYGAVAFIRGYDNRVYLNHYICNPIGVVNCNWINWSEVPGDGFTSSGPAATTFGDNVYVFVRGANDNRIYQNILPRYGQWSGWSEVPSGGFTSSGPSVTVGCDGLLYLFVRGYYDDYVWQNTLGPNGWSGWSQLPGAAVTFSRPGAAALKSNPFSGVLKVFIRGGGDDRIYMNTGGLWCQS
jgi:hypothetical protein